MNVLCQSVGKELINSGLSLLCLRDLIKCPRNTWPTVQTCMILAESSRKYLSYFDLE